MEGFNGGWVIDGDDCGYASLTECAKTAAGVALAVDRRESCRGVVEEDCDLSFEVKAFEVCSARSFVPVSLLV